MGWLGCTQSARGGGAFFIGCFKEAEPGHRVACSLTVGSVFEERIEDGEGRERATGSSSGSGPSKCDRSSPGGVHLSIAVRCEWASAPPKVKSSSRILRFLLKACSFSCQWFLKKQIYQFFECLCYYKSVFGSVLSALILVDEKAGLYGHARP